MPGGYSPFPFAGPKREDRWVGREMDAIVMVLRRDGPLSTRELRRRAEARLWGPGRFRPALARAVAEGRVRSEGRGRWAAAG